MANNNYVVVPKKIVDETLSSQPIQGSRRLEPLKSFIKENKLPILFLEDNEVVNDAEIHRQVGDFFDCFEGEAIFICGGELVDPWKLKNEDGSLNENELRSKTINGGEEIILKQGDALWIPAGCSHQHRCDTVARLRIVKVPCK